MTWLFIPSHCAGVGMLDEGLRAGCEFLGIEQRTVCYVEREAFAASTLVGRMAEKCLDYLFPILSVLCLHIYSFPIPSSLLNTADLCAATHKYNFLL